MASPSDKIAGSIGYGGADTGVSSATTNIAFHCRIYLRGGRLRAGGQGCQERRGAHDLTALTITALRYIVLDPSCAYSGADAVAAVGRFFYGGDIQALGSGKRGAAGTDGLTIQMYRARAAKRGAAAELGPGHAERVAQDPKDGCLRVGIDLVLITVDIQCDHDWSVLRCFIMDVLVADL